MSISLQKTINAINIAIKTGRGKLTTQNLNIAKRNGVCYPQAWHACMSTSCPNHPSGMSRKREDDNDA